MNKVDKNRPVSSIKHEDKRAAIGSDGTVPNESSLSQNRQCD